MNEFKYFVELENYVLLFCRVSAIDDYEQSCFVVESYLHDAIGH